MLIADMAAARLCPTIGSSSSSFVTGAHMSGCSTQMQPCVASPCTRETSGNEERSSSRKHCHVRMSVRALCSPSISAQGLPSLKLRPGGSKLALRISGAPSSRRIAVKTHVVPYDEWLAHLEDTLLVHGPIRDILMASAGAAVALAVSTFISWLSQRNEKKVRAAAEERGPAALPELPPSNSTSLVGGVEMGVGGQKESAEWVNMVLHKIWKVYRRSLEAWLVGLLQPAIDTLPLPSIVTRVRIAEFSLDFEPLSVRNVQRRASRRANDLQYHVGLRYTGDARCLLHLHVRMAGVEFVVPVGVQNLDVDAEMWVKLRLTPRKPYVGTLSIAFVRLPTIKLVLAPFRIVNLFAIPFLSSFLSKLLTVDLPRLLVLPRHITFDFLPAGEDVAQHMASAMVLDLLKSETFTGLAGERPFSPASASSFSASSGSDTDAGDSPSFRRGFSLSSLASAAAMGAVSAAISRPNLVPTRMEPSDAFVGELSVTLCEARNLPSFGLSVFSNPYCRLLLGEVTVDSKRNSETSHPAGARDPVWNQDFHFWVEDPVQQTLKVVVRDSMALDRDIGYVEVPVWQLQDCVPLSMWLPLVQDGPFGERPGQGELRLLLTYKSYVDQEDEEEDGAKGGDVVAPFYIKVFGDSESDVEEADKEEEEVEEEVEEEEVEEEEEDEAAAAALSDPERIAGVKAARAATAAVVGGLKPDTPSAVAAASVAAAAATAATLAAQQAAAQERAAATPPAHAPGTPALYERGGSPVAVQEERQSFVGAAVDRAKAVGVGTLRALGGLAGGAAGYVVGISVGAYDVAAGIVGRLNPFGGSRGEAEGRGGVLPVVSADRKFLEAGAATETVEVRQWVEAGPGPALASSDEDVQVRIRACPVSDWNPPADFLSDSEQEDDDGEGQSDDEAESYYDAPGNGAASSVGPSLVEAVTEAVRGASSVSQADGYLSEETLYAQQRLARMVEWELGSRARGVDAFDIVVDASEAVGQVKANGHKVRSAVEMDVPLKEPGQERKGLDDWDNLPGAK